jgi:hypothetical protein
LAAAKGLTGVTQDAPAVRFVEPLPQEPPVSNAKFVVFDSDSANAEDV